MDIIHKGVFFFMVLDDGRRAEFGLDGWPDHRRLGTSEGMGSCIVRRKLRAVFERESDILEREGLCESKQAEKERGLWMQCVEMLLQVCDDRGRLVFISGTERGPGTLARTGS